MWRSSRRRCGIGSRWWWLRVLRSTISLRSLLLQLCAEQRWWGRTELLLRRASSLWRHIIRLTSPLRHGRVSLARMRGKHRRSRSAHVRNERVLRWWASHRSTAYLRRRSKPAPNRSVVVAQRHVCRQRRPHDSLARNNVAHFKRRRHGRSGLGCDRACWWAADTATLWHGRAANCGLVDGVPPSSDVWPVTRHRDRGELRRRGKDQLALVARNILFENRPGRGSVQLRLLPLLLRVVRASLGCSFGVGFLLCCLCRFGLYKRHATNRDDVLAARDLGCRAAGRSLG